MKSPTQSSAKRYVIQCCFTCAPFTDRSSVIKMSAYSTTAKSTAPTYVVRLGTKPSTVVYNASHAGLARVGRCKVLRRVGCLRAAGAGVGGATSCHVAATLTRWLRCLSV